MKRKIRLVAMVIAGVMSVSLLTSGCGKKTGGSNGDTEAGSTALESTELNIYTWDSMFPQDVLDSFSEEYGVKINYSNFETDEEMLAKLEETKGGDYDIVIADDYILESAIAEGLVKELDKEQIPNFGNIDSRFQGMFYDSEDKYTVPYGAGIPLIVYDPSLTDVEIEGYGDLWDERLKDNVALIGNFRVIDGIVLKTMGESFNTEDISKIEEAGEKLIDLAPNIRAIQDSYTQDLLLSGEVAAAFMYTSQVTLALQNNPDLKAVYPKEGLGYGIMGMFIPSNAPDEDAAYAFMNYILEPKTAAECFEYMGFYCTNKAAEAEISDEMKQYVILPEDAPGGEVIENVSQEAEDKHAEVWARFLDACE